MATSFANGEATQEEMNAASFAARYAVADAGAAAEAARYAAARYVDTRKIQSDRLRDLCAEIDSRS